MRYGKITPTDIDGLIEYENGNLIIFLEFKYENAKLPSGQRRALTTLTNIAKKAGKNAYALACSHHVGIPELDVNAGAALVTEYYNGNDAKKWVKLQNETTCKTFVDYLMGETNGKQQPQRQGF